MKVDNCTVLILILVPDKGPKKRQKTGITSSVKILNHDLEIATPDRNLLNDVLRTLSSGMIDTISN